MIRKYLLPLLAMAGLSLAIWVSCFQSRPVQVAQPVAQPSQAPYDSYVAGAGIIEASTENIAIAPVTAGVVTEIYVQPGSVVEQGAPLFKLDDRSMLAELAVREASLVQAEQKLKRLLAAPRPEEIPPAEARVLEAQAALGDARSQLSLYESVTDKRAVSEDELSRRRFATQVAEARLSQARSVLELLKAGTWKPEIEVARAEVEAGRAQVAAAKTEVQRLTTCAPVAGTILQVKIRLGEFAPTGASATPLMLMGDLRRHHVRVDVDENDAWRIRRDAPAIAFVRGNRDLKTPLTFVRIEPYVIPKRSLTGESTERVDTRVLQVVYAFEPGTLPVYVGQQMDVFIEAQPLGNAARLVMPSYDSQAAATKSQESKP